MKVVGWLMGPRPRRAQLMKVVGWIVGPIPRGGAPPNGEWDPTLEGHPNLNP
jgi:hypothetical protein